MTDVWIPIELEWTYTGESAAIYVGDSAAVRRHGIDVKQNASEGDHYVIRSGSDYLALVGNDAAEFGGRFLRGSVYATPVTLFRHRGKIPLDSGVDLIV
jgi:hypothetical protein